MVILVTYDLNKPGKDYSALYAAMQRISSDYIRPLESVWLFSTTLNAKGVYDVIAPSLDRSDRLFVTEVAANHFGWLNQDDVTWLSSKL